LEIKKTMNVEQTKQIMRLLWCEYGDKVICTENRAKVWYTILGHANYQEAELAVASLLSEARAFPPSVGEVNQLILEHRRPASQDWSTLWDLVLQAGKRSAYDSQNQIKALPEAAQRAIGGAAGLRELALSDNATLAILRAQFRQRLEAINQHVKVEETKQSLLEILPKVNVNIKTIG
jgi:hypothetical protein